VITPKAILGLSTPPYQTKQAKVETVISIGVIHITEKLKITVKISFVRDFSS